MNDRTRKTGILVALLMMVGLLALGRSGAAAIQLSSTPTASTPSASPSPVLAGSPAASPSGTSGAGCVASADGLILPVESNPISNTSTAPGLRIEQVLVENNVDQENGGDAPDHLEIVLVNESDQELSGFQVYYEITDVVTGDKEGYCSDLTGLTIAAGEQRAVHFDNTGAPDHFPDNEFSLYHSSLNEMQVDVTVSATDVAPQTASVMKDAGGDEDPND